MSIPTINFKSGKVFYKGSSKFRGDLILSHHKKVIEESDNFKVAAIAIAAVKCPQHIID